MISLPSIEWNHPAKWPWPIYAWIAFALVGFVKPAWTWLRRRRVAAWPIADGRIHSTAISKPSFSLTSNRVPYVAELHYTYAAAGKEYSGTYKRECSTEREAGEFIRDLENRAVNVRLNTSAPNRSGLLESDIENLLLNRPPAPARADEVPIALPFGYPLLAFFQALAGIGLLCSLCVHIGALLGKRVAPEFFFWGLHIGIFVVWIPAVLVAQRLVGNLQRKDIWKVLLKDSPDWMRYMVYGFFVYAFVNFALFMLHAPEGGGGGLNPPAGVWRGFSGHWMAFYSTAFAILRAAAHQSRDWRECPNGHHAPLNSSFCPECGLRIDRRA